MPIAEAIRLALNSILTSKLRSFFTLLGIMVSVAFLVAVVGIIQGMNAYVSERLTGAMIGTNAFQVRRSPIVMNLLSDEELLEIQKRPRLTREDAEAVKRALPDAKAVALQSGWPPPTIDLEYRSRKIGAVMIFGVTPEYQVVQDYKMAAGEPLLEPDITGRRYVALVGYDVATKLFETPERAIGKPIRVANVPLTIKGVISAKGAMLGQSFDAFVIVPITTFESMYGRRLTTTVSVKMNQPNELREAMNRAEEAMRTAHRLGPEEPNDFALDKADALVAFWSTLTGVLFLVVPAVVAIGIVVGGIVIMNVMLMAVTQRTYEIGLRKSLGARRRDIRRQFLIESLVLSSLGGVLGVAGGAGWAALVATVSPLPARITWWSVGVALGIAAATGIIFGVYPANRAAKLDPITALRAEV